MHKSFWINNQEADGVGFQKIGQIKKIVLVMLRIA